jgi:hypothetical protein
MTLKTLPLIAITLALTGAASAADKPDTSKLPAPAARKDVSWEKDLKPVLEASCAKCHGAEKPKGKYRVDTKENFIKGGESDEKAVIAGKSADSPVVHYVADLIVDMEMPPTDKRDKYPALTKDQIALLRAWIDAGAK